MNDIRERIAAGQALAVSRIKDSEPEVRWFVEAAKVDYDRTSGEPTDLMVLAHFRSYHRYEVGQAFGDYSVEAIAQGLISCIRSALELGMLVADDPPMAKGPTPPHTPLVKLRDARLSELHGGVIPSAVLDNRRLREEQEKREMEKREEKRRNLPEGPSGALSRVTTFVYDIESLRKRQEGKPSTKADAEEGYGGRE